MKIMLDIIFGFSLLVIVDSFASFAGASILWNVIMKQAAKIFNIPIDKNNTYWVLKGVTVKKDAPKKAKTLFRLIEIGLLVPVILWVILLFIVIYKNGNSL